jgi:SAM-dependent methyltransferase
VTGLDANSEFLISRAGELAPPDGRVLDFGCGSGALVAGLRAAGLDAYGVEIRWEGNDYGDIQASELGEQGFLRYYGEGEALPFEDGTFSVIVSNQVFEHVVPLEATAAELWRVLRPDGVMLHLFPSRAALREGHIGIPLAHLLPPGEARLGYVTLMRRLGLGKFKDDKPAREWAKDKLAYIDDWTVYRTEAELRAALAGPGRLAHREVDCARYRAAGHPWLRRALDHPRAEAPARWAFRRLAFEVVELRRDA